MELNLKTYVSGILFCIVSVCCFAQTETFTSMYDLDFNGLQRTTLMNWQINRKYSQAQVFHDTTVVHSGKHPLVIARLPVFPISGESDWSVYSGKLDLRNVKMLDIRIRVKGKLNRDP